MDCAKYDRLLVPSDGNLLFRTLKELHTMKDLSVLNNVRIYDAVGSGTIVAFLLYLDMPPSHIITTLIKTKVFDRTSDGLRTEIGRVIGDELMQMYATVPSLLNLYELRGSDKGLNLHVYNRTTGQLDIINHLTCPDLNCMSACSMSYNLGLTYYEQSYCGHTYIDSSAFLPVYTENDGNILCVHTRSSYYNTIRPSTVEGHYTHCFNQVRERLLDSIVSSSVKLIILYVDSNPHDETMASKLEMLC